MRIQAGPTAVALLVCIAAQLAPTAKACGSFTIDPVFVFHHSPEFAFRTICERENRNPPAKLRPQNPGNRLSLSQRRPYSDFEQQSLTDALHGKAPEENGLAALRNWIAARKELLKENETLPEIYVERRRESYDYFPNCAKTAFEVAVARLKSRIAYQTLMAICTK